VRQPVTVLFDAVTGSAYYLGFDLLLVRAPVCAGSVQAREARVVEGDPSDPGLGARYAAIKVALLDATVDASPGWRSELEQARRRAADLAAAAGLAVPPTFEAGAIRTVDLA
jgi:hypothetical protein